MLDLLNAINMELVYSATILFMPYLTFVFCAEQVNPFFRSSNTPSSKFRRQFGKNMALTMFLATLIANVLLHLVDVEPLVAFSIGGVFFALIGLYLSIKRVIFLRTLA
ncbi:hypothetical protein ACUNV4_03300 [Granulosicoccus sp. 3-233]|uniref:hypothetical protein n=1 Tax=Granulosicoccus sp. 3-233 TaxID=3417969 RepID=UPI003D334E21